MNKRYTYPLLCFVFFLFFRLVQANEEFAHYLPFVMEQEKPTFGTKTVTPTPPVINHPTNTPTPTSMPGPPVLLIPEDGATLPQPVPPGQWVFKWEARWICDSGILITGPGGRQISYSVKGLSNQEFIYTTDEYLPDDALGPWYWIVGVTCPLGSNISNTNTFWVLPKPSDVATENQECLNTHFIDVNSQESR